MTKDENKRFLWPMIGHKNIIDFLQNNLKSGRISHAYLFVGPENIGKSTVANYLANTLVCRHLSNQKISVPCGECDCCRQLNNKIHPDVFWLERETGETGKLKKNIGIEQIRSLQDKLSLHSFLNTSKIAIIDQAHTLSQEAANSLLKTLEEPPNNTVIILLAGNQSALPTTIASRCQVLKFLPVSADEIADHLVKLGCEKKKAKKIAALSFGRPGLAIDLYANPEAYEEFKEMIKKVIEIFRADIDGRFKLIGELTDTGDVESVKQTILIWKRLLRDLALVLYSENFVSNLSYLTELKDLAAQLGPQKILKLLDQLDQSKKYLEANTNPRLTLENLVLNF